MTNNEKITREVQGWIKYGCMPCEIIVRDCFPLQVAHSARDARWCAFLTFAVDRDFFLGEYDTQAQANRAAAQYRRTIERASA